MKRKITNEEFCKLREELNAARRKEGEGKHVSYTRGSENRLANFDNIAERSNGVLTPGVVLYVYMSKHFDALSAYLLKGIEPSEPLVNVIGDLMNYAELAYGMSERDRMENLAKKFKETVYPLTPVIDQAAAPAIDRAHILQQIAEVKQQAETRSALFKTTRELEAELGLKSYVLWGRSDRDIQQYIDQLQEQKRSRQADGTWIPF